MKLGALEGIENPKLFAKECKFVGEKTISVGNGILTADKILIATGNRPEFQK